MGLFPYLTRPEEVVSGIRQTLVSSGEKPASPNHGFGHALEQITSFPGGVPLSREENNTGKPSPQSRALFLIFGLVDLRQE